MAGISNSVCANAQEVVLQSNGGTINIGNDGSDTPINIGGGIGSSEVTILSGYNGMNIGSAGAMQIYTVNGVMQIYTGNANLELGADLSDKNILIGTSYGASPIYMQSGTSGISMSANVGPINIYTGGGAINIAGDSTDTAVTIGTGTGASPFNVSAGSGGFNLLAQGYSTIATAGWGLALNTNGNQIYLVNDGSDTIVSIGSGVGGSEITLSAGNDGLNLIAYNNGNAALTSFGGGISITAATSNIQMVSDAQTIMTPSGGLVITTFTTTGALVSDASGNITDASASTSGYVLTSNGAGTPPSFQPGSASSFTWTDVTTPTVTMAPQTGYIMDDGATLITGTLPATCAQGQLISIQGAASGLFTIAQNAGQTIHFGAINTTTGTGGSLSSTDQYDSLDLLCIVANTDFAVRSSIGNFNWV